ncbi:MULTISPECIES: hypothetical protein [Agrobacterium]|uniref:Uncharacterized protein n=1 Tax=Agrobacterium salinitolerans TaxID=1183413 RepID=A0A4Z1QLK8_9HYPH|nr:MULTISPECIES: hypothetical protein [Agrobacterium]MCZ7853990.1 hypothetical protein [Agrobacterium salinitolerans]MCZ7888410.1 hypothetical protein [Agrobacterium salinitolerans]MDA5628889.1 hypothetical protein [Agrobacterium sp. ST15.16.055]MDA6981362.1 hypothetical protein [Agrobacterium salinitolerans]UYZ09358.1 hypothetical protein CFBP5507_16825 [Agrobacterium salinitolerans]
MRLGGYIALVLGLACACGAQAQQKAEEHNVTYKSGIAYDSNYFADTNRLSAISLRTGFGLNGKITLEGAELRYSLEQEEVRLPRYRFANEHNTIATLGLTKRFSDKLEWAVELRGTRSDAGDIFLHLPEEDIGYRQLDHKLEASSQLGILALGGKNTLTASIASLMKGKARFRPAYFLPTRLEANEALLSLKAEHARSLGGGEAGLTLVYDRIAVPEGQQEKYERFPAQTLRGSLAYGYRFSDRFAVLAEAGFTSISGDEISDKVKHTRPYLRAEAEVKATDRIAFGVGFSQDYALFDPDDPIAEFHRRFQFVMKSRLTEKVGLDLALHRVHKDWIYYNYDTSERRLVATLSFDTGKNSKLELEFNRLLHGERDTDLAYSGSSITSRFSGTF